MVPGFQVGELLSLSPAAQASVHQPCTGVQATPRVGGQLALVTAALGEQGRQGWDAVGLPALAALRPHVLRVSGLHCVSSSELGKRGRWEEVMAQGSCDDLLLDLREDQG